MYVCAKEKVRMYTVILEIFAILDWIIALIGGSEII